MNQKGEHQTNNQCFQHIKTRVLHTIYYGKALFK